MIDFSHLRVHTDGLAQQSARDVNVHAYMVGSHVVFDAGRYAPDSASGKHLLAHELSHEVQQTRGVIVNVQRQDAGPSGGGVPFG